ncbi:unnamed protein product [Schistosoma rodhaini]|uniref:MSP domain-containing protein n=1 Tax=Schistosoma rodhaini TaxID=6188 RepID=A0AA85G1B2_9TREM|nr:unnamed protein product [Schistosoma rodhaini]CAH8598442.1 unnamed protein product [Schistosoma rodhaini]
MSGRCLSNMSEQNLVCLLQKPSKNRSQVISYQLSKIFKNLYQFSALDDDIISYLQAAKDSDDEKHSLYIKEIDKVLKKHKNVIDEVNAAESRIRDYSLNKHLFQNSENVSPRPVPSNSLSFDEIDDSFLGELGILTKEDIYFNGKPRSHDFPVVKSSKSHEDVENINVLPAIKSVVKSSGKIDQLKNFSPKSCLKSDDIISDINLTPSTRSLISFGKRTKENRPLFQAEPESIIFRSYLKGNTYEAIVKVRNISDTSRSIRVLPPKTTIFSINEGKFPRPGSSIIAPGMAAVFLVQFFPDNVGDFEDEFIVKYENQLEPLCVKLLGQKSRPQLNILDCYDMGYALKGGERVNTIQLKNCNAEIASNSKFLFITKEAFSKCQQYDANTFTEFYSIHVNSSSTSLCSESFSLKPNNFHLDSLQSITITVEFKPLCVAEYKWELVLICDNGQFFPVTFKGRGEEPILQIIDIIDQNDLSTSNKSLTNFRKIDTNSNDQFYFYQFPKHYPHTNSPKTMTIRNCCSEPLRFQWIQENEFSEPNLSEYTSDSLIKSDDVLNQRKSLSTSVISLSDKQTDNAVPLLFTINPTTGVFETNEMKHFQICFNPTQVGIFRTQLALVLLGIPEVDEQENCYKLDKKHLSIELEGTAEPLPIAIEPPILIVPGRCLLDVPVYRTVQLVNKSTNCSVTFSWQHNFDIETNTINLSDCTQSTTEVLQSSRQQSSRKYSELEKSNDALIVLEPTIGSIDPGQSINIDIIMSSSKSTMIKESIPCFINILPNSPLWLYIEVEFSGPTIVFDRTDCNFSLMRPNETAEMDVLLTNTTPSPRKWFVKTETFIDKFQSEIKMHPSYGVIKPFQSVKMNLSFTPQVTRSVRDIITVHTEDSEETSKLLILAEVQTPLIDFNPLHIDSKQCFWNVPVTETVTITNLNMLECDLEWIEPIGNDKEWVTINVVPKTYRITGQKSQLFEISICAHKQKSIEDLQIPLRVNGLNKFLYLPITATVQGLSITYFPLNQDLDPICQEISHENINIPNNNISETMILDFGQNVGLFEPVEKWIEFRNNTPIPTRICVDTRSLSTKANYADYENFPNKPILGAAKYLFVISRQSTENHLSSQNVLHDKNDHKTQIRNLYDWCNLLLKRSKGACELAHSAISSTNYITDFQLAELRPITISQYSTTLSTIPSWYLPGYGSLRICFICVANLWGVYEDNIQIFVLPEFDLTSKSYLSPVVFCTSFKVVGCPIYSLAAGHFGELSNKAIMNTDAKNNSIFPKTALPFKASRQFIRFGSALFNGPVVKRQIRLHNSCEAAIRIDWQIFLDSKIEDHNQLINLLCFISEPFKNFSYNQVNKETSLTDEHLIQMETSGGDSAKSQLINLVLRPYDGKLIWESSSAQIISSNNDNFSKLFIMLPEQLIIPPHEEATVTILMNPMEAYSEMKRYEIFNLKAHVVGYLTIDSKYFLDTPRTHALITEQLRFDITAKLEQPRLIIDLNNNPLEIVSTSPNPPRPRILHFKSGLGQFLVDPRKKKTEENTVSVPKNYSFQSKHSEQVSQRVQRIPLTVLNGTNCLLISSIVLLRSIHLRCPNSIPVTICMKANQTKHLGFHVREDKPYDTNDDYEDDGIIIDSEEDANLTAMMPMTKMSFKQLYKPQISLTLNPGKLQKIIVGYLLEKDLCLHYITSNNLTDSASNLQINESDLILKNEILFKFNYFNKKDDLIINNKNDIFQLNIQITIIKPKFLIYPIDILNFDTVLIGQSKKLEIKIQNLTKTPTFWLLKYSEINYNEEEISENNEDNVFHANKISGYLNSFSYNEDCYSDLITVEFKPRKSIQYEATWKFEGILGEEVKIIKLTGIGTFNEYYHTLY